MSWKMDPETQEHVRRVTQSQPCSVCQGRLAPCILMGERDSSLVQQVQGYEREGLLGMVPVHKSAQQHFVCVSCGYIMAFARNPQAFATEHTP